MIELLRLADSKMVFVGGLAVDTVCLGVLALFLIDPGLVVGGGAGNVLLLSLALTAPVLALSAAILYPVIPSTLGSEEVARRMVMAGAVLHGGAQLSVLLGFICNPGSRSTLGYFVSTLFVTAMLSLSLLPFAWILRLLKTKKSARQVVQASPNILSAKL